MHKWVQVQMSINLSLIYCISGLVSHQLSFWDSEGRRFKNEIIMCCYVHYMLKYALKSAVKH